MTPERFGPFLLCERLSGGRAEAWRARRVVAEGQLSAPLLVERFSGAPREVEARLVQAGEWGARVGHPGVVRVLEVGTLDGTLYAVSELAEGHDLGAVLAAAPQGEAGPSVPVAVAIAAQLARVAREVHDESDGREQLGLFRPGDVVLGYDGRVRIRARGEVERPKRDERRDPFLAPELARGAELAPPADVWTVARVLRAVLALDPGGKRTPRVSTLYKDSLGPILEGALARDPSARLSIAALEERLLAVALEDAADLSAPVLELLEEHVGGAIPRDPDALGYADGEALAHDTGSSADVRFPRPGSGATTRGDTTAARPRVVLPPDHELSLDEGTAASAEVRLPSPADEPDADLDAPLDLDAIALSSLEGGPQPSEDPLAGAGTAVVERPPPLPPSQHEDGDVFQPAAPETKISRLSSRERSSLERVSRSGAGSRPAAEPIPAPQPEPPPAQDDDDDGLDVFTATVRPAELLPELVSPPSTRVMRSRAKSAPSAEPGEPPQPDPDKTAYLENPAAAFKSAADERAVRPLGGDMSGYDDDDERPTERLSPDLVKEAVRMAREASTERPPEPSLEDRTEGGTPVEDAELGRLVIEVPPGAVVFVNGEQRGRGPTVLEGLDRFASIVVRVHHRGHQPWTGTVTLKGMPAARIEPELSPR